MSPKMTNRTTIPRLLEEAAARQPDKLFVRCGPTGRTYSESADMSKRVAANLSRVGVAPGDRVAVLLPNRIETLDCFFGLCRLGAVVVPLNVFLKGDFLCHQLSDSRAETLIVDPAGLETVRPLIVGLRTLKRLIVLDGATDSAPVGVDCIPFEQLVGDCDVAPPAPPALPSDLVMILYTSGTTGLPKGCMISHGYCLQVGVAFTLWMGTNSDDVLFTALPLYHVGGLVNCTMVTLMNGMTVVYEPNFSASGHLANARNAGATLLMGVGPMAAALLATAPGESDRDHGIRQALFVPLPLAAQQTFEERFAIPLTTEGYGQTECSPVTYAPPGAPRNRLSAGQPLPWIEIQIVDADDVAVATGEIGEITMRPRIPDAMFQGYWGLPEATNNAYRNLWYHMGDLGRLDEDGFLFFVDRKADVLRRRGENVSSVELEAAIRGISKVAEVAVHAVPSPLGEDDIKACIVLEAGQTTTPEELFKAFEKRLPYFAIPRYVDIVEALTKNELGRVLKHRLREQGVTSATWDLQSLGLSVNAGHRRGS